MSRLCYLMVTVIATGLPSVGHTADSAPSFNTEVIPLLTKVGCNSGACHGKGAGQNGFRLSLRGYAPELDHQWITREFNGRRLDRASPDNSLLLRKAAGQIPHEGGRLMSLTSAEYKLLRNWITAGCPGPDDKEPKVVKLELSAGSQVLKPGKPVQLTAIATFSDGQKRDVTWLTKFESNDPAHLHVSSDGKVTALRHGASAARGHYLTEVAVVVFSVPFDRPVDESLYAGGHNFIDTYIFAKLKELGIEPSGLCTDEEFIRRAFLDTCGILPTPAEVAALVADTDPKKREKLVDALLARPEFNDYWALQLCDLLQNRKERDHDVRGVKGVRQFHAWVRRQVARNRPWDELARDVLTATGSTTEFPAVGYYVVTVGEQRHGENSEAPESVAQAFLGTRIGCARCHNHPLEQFTQDDFFHFAAFFSRVKLERKDSRSGPTVLRVSHPDPNQNKNPVGVVQPRTGVFLKPQPLDRTASDVKPGDDPRVALANWITSPNNPYFSGAMVNRLWRHYFGVGLVEPVDDLRATNPPTNPELWRALNKSFVDSKFDLRALMRAILTSRAYQLSSSTKPGNATDTKFYSHYYARRLPAEVLLDAVCAVTDVPERFDGYPLGVRATQVPDPTANSYFLRTFGRSERVTACACERSDEVHLQNILHLIGGDTLTARLNNPTGWLVKRLKDQKDDDKLLDELFVRALARRPTDRERTIVRELLTEPGANRNEVYRDLCWALLNSKEFVFNR